MSATALMLLLAVTATAPPQEPTGRKRLLVLDFRNDGVDNKTVLIIRDSLTTHLARISTLDVMSTEDVRRAMDVEVAKQAMDCTQESCMAEIANALGADYLVFGNVGSLGDVIVGNMSLLDVKQGKSIGREEIEVRALSDLPPAVREAGTRMIAPFSTKTSEATPFTSPLFLAGVATGAVGAGTAIVGIFLASQSYGVIRDTVSVDADKDIAERDLPIYAAIGVTGGVVTLIGAGLAALPFME
jgi:TolB-like protein